MNTSTDQQSCCHGNQGTFTMKPWKYSIVILQQTEQSHIKPKQRGKATPLLWVKIMLPVSWREWSCHLASLRQLALLDCRVDMLSTHVTFDHFKNDGTSFTGTLCVCAFSRRLRSSVSKTTSRYNRTGASGK